nr:hypothetical protein [Tanacetum cinerariifolium]
MLPVVLTNEDIRNSKAYKEYYAIASGAAPLKNKASVKKTKSSSDTTITPPNVPGTRLSTLAKGKKPAQSSKAKGLTVLSEVAMTEAEQMKLAMKRSLQQTHISKLVDLVQMKELHDGDQDDNDDVQDTNNDDDDFIHPKLSIHEEEAKDVESFDPIVQTPKNSDDKGNDDASLGLNVSREGQDAKDDDEELYRDVNINLEGRDVQMADVHTTQEYDDTHVTLTLFMQTNQFAGAVSSIPGIVERYMDQRMNEVVKVAVQIESDRLQDEAQAKNDEFLINLDENIQKIIKEQVKEQVKVQVFKILPKIEKTVNEQLEAEVLTRSSNSSKTSYDVAADLSEIELKKILIEKMESNKRCDDADKDEEPFAGSDRGSRRRREGKEPESTSAPNEKATKTTDKSTQGLKSHHKTTSESAPAEEPM